MTMRPIRGLMLLVGFVAYANATMHAADVKVIVNPSVTASSISASELKDVFLAVRTTVDGAPVEPVLGKHGPTHEAFLKEYLGKSDVALTTYFRSLVFTGKAAMPKSLDSDAEIAAYVARTKGAIGYVSATANAPGTKTLDIR
jgi:ABC-type phosphate transport system substrate-binding protein